MPKTVEYKKEVPEGLVLGRNKPLPGVRVRVERFQYGRQDLASIDGGILESLKSMFGQKGLEDGFNGYKITTWKR